MRELFETGSDRDPITTVRRSVRPALQRRFYERVGTTAASEGFAVLLDDKPIRTPARHELAAPTLAIAQAIAAEWAAQGDVIDPATMPLTHLANTIIDGVASSARAVAGEIEQYLASDLLFYRATTPHQLRLRQMRHWDPVLEWARDTLGANFRLGEGVVPIAQPEAALSAAKAAIPADPWLLGALHTVTTLTGSAVLALALWRGRVSADEVWRAAHVDEDWNMEQWGRDAMALERRAFRFAEFAAAATVLTER